MNDEGWNEGMRRGRGGRVEKFQKVIWKVKYVIDLERGRFLPILSHLSLIEIEIEIDVSCAPCSHP